MGYEYSDPKRENEPTALPNVEIFYVRTEPGDFREETEPGYYYAFGFPGCLYDSEPVGPFPTYDEALEASREDTDEGPDGTPDGLTGEALEEAIRKSEAIPNEDEA